MVKFIQEFQKFLYLLSIYQTILFVFVLVFPLYLLFHYKKSTKIIKSIKKKIIRETKRAVYDDGILIDKRLKPIYDKVSKRVSKGVEWIEKNAQKKGILSVRRNMKSKGDGLHSIFSQKNLLGSPAFVRGKRIVEDVMPSTLRDNEEFAFRVLYEKDVFEGADSSVLRDIVREVSTISLKSGEYLFRESDLSGENLFILKSGNATVEFPDLSCELKSIDEFSNGSVIASQVDVIAWITGLSLPRQLSVLCTEDSVFLKIPSPHGREVFKSGLHLATFARSVRMLLVRINRTTVATALFHLGLADIMLPAYEALNVPKELITLCDRLNDATDLAEKATLSDARIVTPLVRKCISNLYGFTNDNEVDVTASVMVDSRPLTPSTTPVRRGKLGTPLSPLSLAAEKSGGKTDVSTSGADSIHLKDSLASVSRTNLVNIEESSASPIPPPFTRSLSFDSALNSGVDLTKLANDSVKGATIQHRSIQTRLFRLHRGQSILDADVIPGLYIVISGEMKLSYSGRSGRIENSPLIGRWRDREHYLIRTSGAILGHVALFSGNSEEWYGRNGSKSTPPMSAVVASQNCWLIGISINSYLRDLVNRPSVIFHISTRLVSALPPILRLFDFCVKWKKVESGENIVTKGSSPTGELQVLLFGRLGVITADSPGLTKNSSSDYLWNSPTAKGTSSTGTREISIEKESEVKRDLIEPEFILGKGSLIGETQLLTGENFKYTVRTMRNSSLAVVPLPLLNFLSQEYPSILTHIARNVSLKQHAQMSDSQRNVQCLMILPVSGSLPFDLVCSTLKHCLENYVEKVTFFSSADVASVFGGSPEHLSDSELFMTVGSWLHELEVNSDLLVFQADWQYTAWNRLISSMCDEIVLVANAIDDPELSEVEERLRDRCFTVPKTLVMVHINPTPDYQPSGTRKWIEQRQPVQRHVHLRLNSRHMPYDKYHHKSDFHRLARILTNNAVGLVLGGGGARGLSHLGIIQALEERGIPIDFVGGTSIGSFIGGMYAREQSFIKVLPIAKSYCKKMSSLWFHVQDLTLPITSYFNGLNFMRAIRDIFGERKIEDFWLNYYCITTDLTSMQELVHANGTASRYIRASMSLANYFPPVCDVDVGDKTVHFLVDGGYTNIVPVDVMKNRLGARLVFAVDVSSGWGTEANHNYGDSLTGLSVIISRWNPWAKEKLVLSMSEIGDRLAFVAAITQFQRAKVTADLFLTPPVSHLSGTDFSNHEEVRKIGLEYGRQKVNSWYDSFMSSERGEEFKWLGKSGPRKETSSDNLAP